MTGPPARVRRFLECLGGAVTVASAVLWAWVARGLHRDVAITGLVGAAGLAALLLSGGRVRRAAAVLLFVVAALRIAVFYGERGHGEEATGRLALLPAGRALLTVTVFLVLYQHVLLALPWMRRLSRGRRGFLLTLGLVSSTAIAADLYFLPDRIGVSSG